MTLRTPIAALLIFAAGTLADERTRVVGHWSSGDSIFEIYEEKGSLYGQIRVLAEPLYAPGERPGYEGQPKVDSLNPDPALQSRPIIGLHMFSGYEFRGGTWQGQIYDPETGNTYQSRMKVDQNGVLEIRGYIGMPMFGRTARFAPVSHCDPQTVTMLRERPDIQAC